MSPTLLFIFRTLNKRKFYSFLNLTAVSFTLMVITVTFTIIDQSIFKLSPKFDTNRVIIMNFAVMYGHSWTTSSNPGYKLLTEIIPALSHVESYSFIEAREKKLIFKDKNKFEIITRKVDTKFWELFQFEFLEGRPFQLEEFQNRERKIVITKSLSDRLFNEQSAIGKTVEIAYQFYEVVGVINDIPTTNRVAYAELFSPLTLSFNGVYEHGYRGNSQGLIQVEASDKVSLVQQEIASRVRNIKPMGGEKFDSIKVLADLYPEALAKNLMGISSDEPDLPGIPRILSNFSWILVLFLLFPALNLVNINSSRIAERHIEIGVRKAFGATKYQLMKQFLFENIVVTFIGGALGILLTYFILFLIELSGWLPHTTFTISLNVFLLMIFVMILFSLLSGFYPAWKMSSLQPTHAFQGGKK